jgi:hypothetical protein
MLNPALPPAVVFRDQMTLALEGTRYEYPGAKDRAIHELLGETPARFYQRLGQILDDPHAPAYDARLVNRLRRLREQHLALRTAHRAAPRIQSRRLSEVTSAWAQQGSNLRPPRCKRGALPLSYAPLGPSSRGLSITRAQTTGASQRRPNGDKLKRAKSRAAGVSGHQRRDKVKSAREVAGFQ